MVEAPRVIRIAAALINDGAGRTLLVRKAGTQAFMQAGGKIEPGERPLDALLRELAEELNLSVDPATPRHLGTFHADAANEIGCRVEAEVFHLSASGVFQAAAELAEAVWVTALEAETLVLAPLTRDHVLPLAFGGARSPVREQARQSRSGAPSGKLGR